MVVSPFYAKGRSAYATDCRNTKLQFASLSPKHDRFPEGSDDALGIKVAEYVSQQSVLNTLVTPDGVVIEVPSAHQLVNEAPASVP